MAEVLVEWAGGNPECSHDMPGVGTVCDCGAIKVMRFSSGAHRSPHVAGMKDERPVRYDLISPVLIRRLAETYAEGAKKYGDNNWQKGVPVSDLLNRAIAHLFAYLDGDTSEDHLAHAMWNVGAVAHFEERPACSPTTTDNS